MIANGQVGIVRGNFSVQFDGVAATDVLGLVHIVGPNARRGVEGLFAKLLPGGDIDHDMMPLNPPGGIFRGQLMCVF